MVFQWRGSLKFSRQRLESVINRVSVVNKVSLGSGFLGGDMYRGYSGTPL